MFEIEKREESLIAMSGRLDASQVPKAEELLATVTGSTRIDLSGLDYISSVGLSVILRTYKRLEEGGYTLTLRNPSPHVRNIFHYAGLDQVLEIE